MSKEILYVADAVSNEKGVDKEIIFEAIEAALASATRKKHGKDIEVRVDIDRETGDYDTYRRWLVIDNDQPMENPLGEITLEAAQMENPDIQVGDYIEEQIESVEFGRIAAQTAKQVIVSKVREAERERVVEAYQGREGELVMGTVKRVERGNVYLDLGSGVEGFIPKSDMIPREAVRPGDRLRGYLKEVRSETRGPQLFISRTAPEFLVELFKLEVPEVDQGLLDILGAARDPGSRAKISVKALDSRIDPVGACVGMRGSRVQSVSNEIGGERVDIILWDEDPAQFVINAMSPAEVLSLVVDEDNHSMNIAVDEDKLAMAIGRGGQNIRLASELTGWELNVMTEEEAEAKNAEESAKYLDVFIKSLDVDAEVAEILVSEGFTTIEEVAYVPEEELLAIDEFDEDIVTELRNRASDYLLTQAIMMEEVLEEHKPQEDLLAMEGMDTELAYQLAAKGVCSMEDLAEQSVDELMEIEGMDEERASALIMTARAPWFAEAEEAENTEAEKAEAAKAE
ncbi:MAG TPA: transcription termination/antitermination protein NusA [Gammaproteobacteria bacterium]|nr:transcription termination/antitermination protein NusA [Gammaproteobacteria bacterium]